VRVLCCATDPGTRPCASAPILPAVATGTAVCMLSNRKATQLLQHHNCCTWQCACISRLQAPCNMLAVTSLSLAAVVSTVCAATQAMVSVTQQRVWLTMCHTVQWKAPSHGTGTTWQPPKSTTTTELCTPAGSLQSWLQTRPLLHSCHQLAGTVPESAGKCNDRTCSNLPAGCLVGVIVADTLRLSDRMHQEHSGT